jgi:hypothetical protein
MMYEESVLSFFNQASHLKNVGADFGLGMLGDWPPEGEYVCELLDLEIKDGKFNYKPDPKKPERETLPCLQVQAHYQMLDDPEAVDGVGRIFHGSPIQILRDDLKKKLPPNQQTRVEIMGRRYNGYVETLTGIDSMKTDPKAALISLGEVIDEFKKQKASIGVRVRLLWRQDQNGVPKPDNDFIIELLSSLST